MDEELRNLEWQSNNINYVKFKLMQWRTKTVNCYSDCPFLGIYYSDSLNDFARLLGAATGFYSAPSIR